MFSEYASRFLAQSQSRLSFGQPEQQLPFRNPLDRQRASRTQNSRAYLPRQGLMGPYQGAASQLGRFPFTSRTSNAQAPLFYSATDEFREEDDADEHEREVADFYALQRSRRTVGVSRMTDSSEEPDEQDDLDEDSADALTRGRGIRSSWREGTSTWLGRTPHDRARGKESDRGGLQSTILAGKGKGALVDVELASAIEEDPEELLREPLSESPEDEHPPPYPKSFMSRSTFMPRETDEESQLAHPRPPSPDSEGVPQTVTVTAPEPPRNDQFWASLYLVSLASIFASYLLVWLHTSTPTSKNPLGDTVYTVLRSSYHLLAVDTLVAIIVAVLWLFILRSFVRPLVLGILAAVPIILFSFSLYPFASSFKGSWHGDSVQDRVMRWFSFLPSIFAVVWIYTVYKGRHSLSKSIEILEFACKILAASPMLVILGFGVLTAVVLWSWVWMMMFTRVFLEGHISKGLHKFIIDTGTWWLGVFFVFVYLWTLAVLSGIQRATTAATVSQWYFHRLAVPTPSSRVVVQASFQHATGPLFGTICLATLLTLAIRLPLLILPRRLAGFVTMAAYSLIPTPIATLTNPLTLTYAAIHSQPLAVSARGLSNMHFVSKTSPTTTLTPNSFSPTVDGGSLLPYRLAKLLLHATRFITSLALGFGGWVSTARLLNIPGSEVQGSLYAYVVGLIAGAIGWGVLGATEGVLSGIVDAAVVCWGSETGRGEGARYCREAGELFGGRVQMQ